MPVRVKGILSTFLDLCPKGQLRFTFHLPDQCFLLSRIHCVKDTREIPSIPYLDEEGWIRFKLSPEPKSPRFNYRAQLFEGLNIYLSREDFYSSNHARSFLPEGFCIYAKNKRPITGWLSAKDERYINQHIADISGFERIEGRVSSKQPGENGDYTIEIAIQLPENTTPLLKKETE